MEFRKKKIEMNGPEGTVYLIGDFHVGLRSCAKDEILKAVEVIKNDPDLLFWIGMGDHIDAITHKDRRYEEESIDPELNTPTKQMAWLHKAFKPIKKSCLGLHLGNHEATLAKEIGNFMEDIVCPGLGVDYLGFVALQTLVFPRGEHILFTTHGDGSIGGRTFERPEALKANKIQRLRRIMVPIAEADLYAMGHVHQLIAEEPPSRPTLVNTTQDISKKLDNGAYECGTCVKRDVFDWPPVVATGSFLATYQEHKTNYGERSLYHPLDIGFVKITYDQYGDIVDMEEVKLG